METQQELCAQIYLRPFHADYIPKLAVLKRMCYSARIDRKMPALTRVPLSSLRVHSLDPTLLLLKRWLVGMCLVSAGTMAPHGFETGGYGDIRGAYMWLSWIDCLDLLETLETQFVRLSDNARTSVIESLIDIIAASTGLGTPRITASCAVGRAVSDAVRIIASAAAADANPSHKRKIEDADDQPKKLGPNGLVRMKGGNPEGAPCKDFAKGKCPRTFCCWSHATTTTSTPAPDADA